MPDPIINVDEQARVYKLTIDAQISGTYRTSHPVLSMHPNPSQELDDQFDAYVLNHENGVKSWPDWLTPDASRGTGTYTLTPNGMTGAPGATYYDIDIQFPIAATVRLFADVTDPRPVEELQALFEQTAAERIASWLADHQIIPQV